MAAPVVQDVTTTDFGSDSTTHNANMPATVNVGDLLLAIACFDQGDNHGSVPSGWSRRLQIGFEDPITAIYFKVADGTEDGTTVNFATDTAQKGSVQVYRITGYGSEIAKAVFVSEVGASIADMPALLCFTGRPAADILWITWTSVSSASSILTGAAAPTGYGNAVISGGTGTDHAQLLSARKSTTGVVKDDPAANWDTNGIACRYGILGVVADEFPAADEIAGPPVLRGRWIGTFAANTTAHSTPITPGKNQLLIAWAVMDSDGTEAIATPSGWTREFYRHTNNSVVTGLYTKRATGAETEVDFVTTNAQGGSVVVWAYEHCGSIAGVIAAADSTIQRHPISYFYQPYEALDLLGFRSTSGGGYTYMGDWVKTETPNQGAANVGNFQTWETLLFPIGNEDQFPGANNEPSNGVGIVHAILVPMPEFANATLSGTITLSGSPVQNVSVYAHEVDGNRVFGPVLTDASGNYSLPVVDGYLYDVSIQYENGGQKYNAPTAWGVTPVAA